MCIRDREQIVEKIPEIRKVTGDRAILRAYHFQGDNQRVVDQVAALENNDFQAFLKMVIESGYSSYMYNQNIFDVVHKDEQVVSLAPVSYTHLRAHETVLDLVCRLLLEKKNK